MLKNVKQHSVAMSADIRCRRVLLYFGVLLLSTTFSCRRDKSHPQFQSKNYVVLIMDGARYSETWGDSTHQWIPRIGGEMADEGVIFSNFRNNGPTYTNAGHTALLTGHYQEISNIGAESPERPNYLSVWMKENKRDRKDAWIIASKDKIEALATCTDPDWAGKYEPSTDCGVAGLGSGYRSDSVTVQHILDTMSVYHPSLVFVNFRQPDFTAHQGNWSDYLNAIQQADEHCYQVWKYLKEDPYYANNTTLLITNDHGRHLDSVSVGFIGHGDDCEGCRHIMLYGYGPDFKKGIVVDKTYEQIDVPFTLANMMGFTMSGGEGKLIKELF